MNKRAFDRERFIQTCHKKIKRAKEHPDCEWMEADAQAAEGLLKMLDGGQIKLEG